MFLKFKKESDLRHNLPMKGKIVSQFRFGSIFRLALLSAEHIEADGGNKERAFDNVLHTVSDVEQGHFVIKARDYQSTETRAEDRTAAAD